MSLGDDASSCSTAFTVSGSALLWAWGFLCYLSPALFPYSTVSGSVGIESAFFTSQITAGLFAFGVFLVLRRRQVVVQTVWLLVAAIGLSASVVLDEAVLGGCLPSWMFYISGVIDGIGVPLLGVAWGTRYCLGMRGRFRVGSLVLLSFLVAYGLYFLISLLPYPSSAVVTFVVPLFSWLLWHLDARRRHELGNDVLPMPVTPTNGGFPGEVSAGDRNVGILPWRALSLIAFASLTANLVCSYVMGWDYQSVAMVSGGVVVVASITTMAYVMSILQEEVSVESVYRFSLPFTVVGLLVMLVFGKDGTVIGGALVTGCGMFMQSLVMFKVVESTRRQGISPLLSFSVGQGVVAITVFLGNIGGKLLVRMTGFSLLALDILCALGVIVLFFMLLYLERVSSERARPVPAPDIGSVDEPSLREPPASEDVLRGLAREHALTQREAEIFELLAKGRSLPFIADQLFVTTGTVKTHTMHIYRKLDISNRQELIDLVDANLR